MQHIAFFRGINVGGRNIVKMGDLKQLFLELGFRNARTYIQSGNVVFDAVEPPDSQAIQAAFTRRFGFESAVLLRSGDELREIVRGMPFSFEEVERVQQECPDVEHLYVFLSAGPIDVARIQKITSTYSGRDRLILTEREAYLLCHESIRSARLATALGKPALGLTARNMGVMHKLSELLND
jgi:uncharacterized protein (DUF1697 family)